jgi:hypothetical protein
MTTSLPAHYLHLVQEATLKSFWRRDTLNDFLRRCGVANRFFATWSKDETKRDLLKRLFPLLETNAKGPEVIARMARELIEQKAFPDLVGWEDSQQKLKDAKEAVAALSEYVRRDREATERARQQAEVRKRAAEARAEAVQRTGDLAVLASRLTELAKQIGTQKAGYDFQDWFYDLVGYFEVPARRPYNVDGRQIDGSITLEGTTYLIETKFTSDQASATDVDTFLVKVGDKADNTMGIMVSMAGYSSVAIKQASKPKTPLLLMDFNHIYLILHGGWKLPEVIARLRRHASQTTEAYLPAAAFSI